MLKLAKVKQRLPLNKTNATGAGGAWGPMTDQLDRHGDRAAAGEGAVFRRMVAAIRVQPVRPKRRSRAPAAVRSATSSPGAPSISDAAEPDEWPDEIVDDIPWEDDK